jgi:hypothetical protein
MYQKHYNKNVHFEPFFFNNHIMLYKFKLIDICLGTKCEQVLWPSIFANSTSC